MKTKVVDGLVQFVKKNYKDYDEIKTAELRYGLATLYNNITKSFLIFTVALFLGVFKNLIITFVFYNILRTYAHGLHATKSTYCLISSLVLFVIVPVGLEFITISLMLKLLISIFCVLLFFKNAPADTHKHPLIRREKRTRCKIITVCLGLIFTIALIIVRDNFISNAIVYVLILENVLISPSIYKLFNLPYANYKSYVPTSTN